MNKGAAFEDYIHFVYQHLLALENDEVIISKNAKIKKNNNEHQIDIFYEFTKAGITHRVAIECKNTTRPVDKGRVHEFESKLRDLNNVIGVMVSQSGYQEGAKNFAESKGIATLTTDSLPSFLQVIGLRMIQIFLPDKKERNEPFYCLMQVRDGALTGSYEMTETKDGEKLFSLFISKKHAEEFIKLRGLYDMEPRVLKHEAFDYLMIPAKKEKAFFSIFVTGQEQFPPFHGIKIDPEDLKKEYQRLRWN